MPGHRLPDLIHHDWKAASDTIGGRLCRALLHRFGWRIVIAVPRIDKAVIVFHPHTSNWDFVIGLLTRYGVGIPVTWAGKDNLFRWPFTGIWRRLGGIPVNRRERTGFVEQMLSAFAERSQMLLAIAPEGTRRHTEFWKSGFYRVALGAHVPLLLAFIDFPRREVGVAGMIEPTGDVAIDFERLRAFYADKVGRHPEKAGPIALRPDGIEPEA